MDYTNMQLQPHGSGSLSCLHPLFHCFRKSDLKAAQYDDAGKAGIGVERDMRILYQQPHLVEPMKLTVYDELPSTPGLRPPSAISRVVTSGRSLASRASERASFSVKKRLVRGRIGAPQLRKEQGEDCMGYRRLELSIYLPNNRLSDLPEFDAASFTEEGTIKLPPRALLRSTRSAEALCTIDRVPSTRRTTSMCGERDFMHARQPTASSVISTSRPPSDYDALHSHPVSMISVPGMPRQLLHLPTNSVTVLSPIRDEFTPPISALMDDVAMDSAASKVDVDYVIEELPSKETFTLATVDRASESTATATLPINFRTASNKSFSTQRSKRPVTSSPGQSRVTQWIHNPNNSSVSSFSTIKTLDSASSSFSEHRRQKSQFYQCQPWDPSQQQAPVEHLTLSRATEASTTRTFSPPRPLAMSGRNRTRTVSSSSVASSIETVDTAIMSLDSDTSVSSAPVVQDLSMASRTGAVKGASNPSPYPLAELQTVPAKDVVILPQAHQHQRSIQVVPVTKSVEELSKKIFPPPLYDAGSKCSKVGITVAEIEGPLRSPGVGVAF